MEEIIQQKMQTRNSKHPGAIVGQVRRTPSPPSSRLACQSQLGQIVMLHKCFREVLTGRLRLFANSEGGGNLTENNHCSHLIQLQKYPATHFQMNSSWCDSACWPNEVKRSGGRFKALAGVSYERRHCSTPSLNDMQ